MAGRVEITPAPPDLDGAAFSEPWQAEAFALAVALNQKGVFAWREWIAQFAARAGAKDGQSDGDAYFERWLAALEDAVRERGFVDAAEIERRVAAWRRAYLNTPHGQPVELSRGVEPDSSKGEAGRGAARDDEEIERDLSRDHRHHGAAARVKPVAISPPIFRRA
jgi:nitrile hydratase accessory protein